MKQETPRKMKTAWIYKLVATALMIAGIAIDLETPKGVADGMLYLPAIIMTLFMKDYRYTVSAGVISTVLIVIGYYYSPEIGNNPEVAVVNRIISVIAAWLVVILICVYMRSVSQVQFYKERMEALFQHAGEGILLVNPYGDIEVTNPMALQLLGFEEEDLLHRSYEFILSPGAPEEDATPFVDLDHPESYTGRELIVKARRKDGTSFPAAVHVWEFHYTDERYFIFYLFDLTEKLEQARALKRVNSELRQKSAELTIANQLLESKVKERTAELQASLGQLEDANEKLRSEILVREEAEEAKRELHVMLEGIVNNFPNGFVGVLNPRFEFEYVRGQELGDDVSTGKPVPAGSFLPMNLNGDNGQIQASLSKAFCGESVTFEYKDPRTENYYLANAVPLMSDDEICRVLLVSQNISNLKEAESEIRRTLERERELNVMKSRFVSTASHEFRTPLTAIVSSASLIAMYKRTEDEQKRKKHIDRITISVANLTEMLNDFLSLEKIEEGKIKHVPVEFDIRPLCDDLGDEFAGLIKPGQKIVIDYDLDKPVVMLDKHLLRNILMNLISNAVKYSPERSTIRLRVKKNEEGVSFSVQDNGIGIPPEDQKHLFETFYRGTNVENIKGTGMGLHIVKRYLEVMEGDIWFRSALNEGSCFTVTFPAKVAVL
jgi:PAS domain S-box-containing protein